MSKKAFFFLLVCFAIPVPCVLLIRIIDEPAIAFALFGIQAAAPSIAALLTAVAFGGPTGAGNFLARCYGGMNPARTPGLALVALAVPLAVAFCAKFAYVIIAHVPGEFFGQLDTRKIMIVCWALVAEELGWRGFLQPELASIVKRKIFVPLAVGCVWALWHYHYYWTGSIDVPALIFLAGCIAESYVYYSLTARGGGNVGTASLWHFAGNLALAIFAINPEANGGDIAPYCVYMALMCALGVACLAREFMPRGKGRLEADKRTIRNDDHAR